MRFNDDENAKLLLETVPAVMRSIREEMRRIARGKFTVPQFRILNRLRRGPMTNSELAEWMGVTAPTMSRMVEPLEKKELIVREFNPNDRRYQTLSLSTSGKREAEKIRRQAQECFAAKAERLSSEESHVLANGLKVLAKMFKDSESGTDTETPIERTKPSMSSKSTMLMVLVALTATLTGCMGDKTAEDYANERSRREQAKLDAIQGPYRGTLTSEETGQSLGSLELDLYSDADVVDSSDNLTKIQKPVAKGTLAYSGLNQSQVSFDKYYYDDQQKILQIQIPIVDVAGQTQTLSLHATLDDGTLSGEITTLGGFSGTFSLVKNGPVSQAQHLNSGRATAIAAGNENFVGQSPEEGPTTSYSMSIQYQETRSQQLFLNLFLPERTVAVTTILNGIPVLFKDAILDERMGQLTGNTIVTSGNGSSHSITLRCTRSGDGTPALKWDCKTSAENKVHHILFGLANI